MTFLPSSVIVNFTRFFALIMILITSGFLVKQADADSSFVTAAGTKLYLHGQEYQFTGVNAFNLATFPGYNAGCGGYVENLDNFFSVLRLNSAVRLWAFQGAAAINPGTKKLDWAGLDRVVNAASKNGVKLILVLGNQDGNCDDGHYKDKAWYLGGYKQAYNDSGNGLTPLPYLDYVKAVVNRYKDSTAVAIWEPMNEPAAGECVSGTGFECYNNLKCSDEQASAAALKSFFDSVGATIKSIDANHLISSGALGNGQCGTIFENYQFVHSSNGIDVGSYHDYDRVDQLIPGDEWNGLQKRINQMANLNKPLYIGEVGMIAHGPSCMTLNERRDKMKAKMDAQFAAGIAGYTPWSLTLGNSTGCNYDIVANDPLLTLLRDYPVKMSSTLVPPSTTPFPVPTPKPADTQPPTPPTSLTASKVTNSSVTLNWSGATDNVSVNRYEIYKDWSYVSATTNTTFDITGLTSGKTYLFYIKSRDNAGNTSGESIKLNVYIPTVIPTPTPTPKPTPQPDTQVPTAPTGITASNVTSTQLTLNWTGATDDVGIDRYEVYRDWSYVTAVWGSSYTFQNLTPGKSYLFYIKTRDKSGKSSGESVKFNFTMPSNGTTPTSSDTQPPTAPTVITPSKLTSTSVTLTWSGASDNFSVNRYEIYKDWQYVSASFTNSFTVTGLTPGKTYLFYLKSRDLAGNSSGESIKVTVTTPGS